MKYKKKNYEKGRRKLRSHKIMLNFYPWDLPSKFAFDPKCETMANYIFRLMYYIATLLGSALRPQGYAILHDSDVVTKHDLAKEKSRLVRVFRALKDNTDDLFPAIYTSGKLDLLNKNIRNKAAEMTLEEFIAAYMYYTPEMIGSQKKVHITVILVYAGGENKFYLPTVWKTLYNIFGDGNGKLKGISSPFITGCTLAHDVRYLLHMDDPEKFQYHAEDIICLSCSNALDLILKGNSNKEFSDLNKQIIQLEKEAIIENVSDFLLYLEEVDPKLYYYANTPKGFKVVQQSVRDYSEKKRFKEAQRAERERLERQVSALEILAGKNSDNNF